MNNIQYSDSDCINNVKQQIRYVSHEIRNHLSICDMYTQIIKKYLEKDSINNASVNNALEYIQKSLQIVGMNLNDLKSIDASPGAIRDFKTLVIKAANMSKAYIEDKDIEFEIFVKNSANICIDENRYLSCIINIIKNGIEAIDLKGKISIYGEIKDKKAILKLINNGKPIPPDKQDRIFDCGYTTKSSGSGLGLDICKKYLTNQNSTLELVKSNKSETIFKIITPTV